MEDPSPNTAAAEARILGITFALSNFQEIRKSSVSDCPISHPSQLSNPFLGLPLETGKCESCGTSEAGKCEGHFGYIELPTPIYHPDHIGELKKMLSLLCLKCLKFKNRKAKTVGIAERMLYSCCEETSQLTIYEREVSDGVSFLELKVPSRARLREGFWNFLEKYGFRYGHSYSRPLLPSEVASILKKLPEETKRKLILKGYFPQDGYVLQFLPVPPNCLSVPDISDGIRTMSTDYSISLLRKVLRQVETIKRSRSGRPNFESQEIEAIDLQAPVAQYLLFRGTGKAARDVDSRFGVNKEVNESSNKAWIEKMKTLFISKGSGFSSRSVITGDPFKGVAEIGLPYEIAQKITFEERVNQHNIHILQKLVDEKLCLTYRDGGSMYSLREGSKGHTFLKPGQVVHRRIVDGDIVFINRPPTTHKHSLQALRVYVHDDHTVKINPLICGPLAADFDGDCIHLFYPQSLEARAEVVELFSVEKQLLSSHTGNFNLQLATDSLLSLKILHAKRFFRKQAAQQLAMFLRNMLSPPAVVKSRYGPQWTSLQILQATLPPSFSCSGEKHMITNSEILNLEVDRDSMASFLNDLVTSVFFLKGPKEVLGLFNSMQPLLMDSLYTEGFSVSLKDFFLPLDVLEDIQEKIQKVAPLLAHLYHSYSESIVLQLESYLNTLKSPISEFIVNSSAVGFVVDSKSESALTKVVQQIGFLGLQICSKGKFYTETLVEDMSCLFQNRYPSSGDCPTEEFGLVGKPLFRGLNPYQQMVHSIASREVIVRSSRGLAEPGTLFKNLMAILRDVIICYDGTVRNVCSNSVIQFEYGVNNTNIVSEFCPGDPVGVLAATAMSNPAYKAVLDSSSSSNSSWKMMKDILLCGASFKNDVSDRRLILYLNDCDCGRKHCQESAALVVRNQLKKVSLRDAATEFLIEYQSQTPGEHNLRLVGHIHLNKMELMRSNVIIENILEKCQETVNLCQKKKKIGKLFKRVDLFFSELCTFCESSKCKSTEVPCVQFGLTDNNLERASHDLADTICPVLLHTVIKGDPRVSTVDIVWQSPGMATWIRSPSKSPKGEMALDIVLEKETVKKSGDAWRVVMDACLPVMHLIDTRRSIPYAIKQVQELLGISCTFEQAVQRLLTSVTMVTKGVLKDHLLLLGNNMTCAGTLIGFNTGGIKALSHSLDVRAPFMNATLFTPRKCFERAAEKCHIDKLSSIVGSCAWGKQVCVGTGSSFEILWNTRKTELMPREGIDVYNFLHMVNSTTRPNDMGTSYIGTDIEELDQELMGVELSPQREPGSEFTFEDGYILEENGDEGGWNSKVQSESNEAWNKNSEKISWDKKDSSEESGWAKKGGDNAWGKRADFKERTVEVEHVNNKDWGMKSEGGSWDKKSNSEESGWGKKSDEKNSWGKKVDSEHNQNDNAGQSHWGAGADSLSKHVDDSGWGIETRNSAWGKNVDSDGGVTNESGWGKKAPDSAWGKNVDSDGGVANESGWCKKAPDSAWGENVDSDGGVANESGWGKKAPGLAWGENVDSDGGVANESGWGKKAPVSAWGKNVDSDGSVANESGRGKKAPDLAWGKKVDSEQNQNDKADQSSWGTGADPPMKQVIESGWGKETPDSAWVKKVTSDGEGVANESGWGKKAPDSARGKKVDSDHNQNAKAVQNSWGAGADPRLKQVNVSGWGKKSPDSAWGKKVNTGGEGVATESGWGQKAPDSAWGKKVDSEDNRNEKAEQCSWGTGAESRAKQVNDSGWGKNSPDSAWGKKVNPDGEGAASESGWGKKVPDSAWGKKGKSDGEGVSNESGWGKKAPDSVWGKKVNSNGEGSGNKQNWSLASPVESQGDRWGDAGVPDSNDHTVETEPSSHGWGSTKKWGQNKSDNWSSGRRQSEDSSSLDHDSAPSNADNSGDKGPHQWGRGRGRGRGRGWGGRGRGRGREGTQGRGGSSTDGEWQSRRPPHGDDANSPALFTTTRQRLDLFTAEEQDILSDAESILKNIKRIMHATGYTDGDPLSADDQTYIFENVFDHHPEKSRKIGAGLDYMMVNRHPDFPDTRCLFVVTVDGVQSDFSYIKCLENYFRIKYPEKAETFIPKYFKKSSLSRPGWNRNRGPSQPDAGTPGLDDVGTPVVSTPVLDDAGTPNAS